MGKDKLRRFAEIETFSNVLQLDAGKVFKGIDYKGNRIWRGAKTALEDGVNNVAFLRMQIENLVDYFAPGEVDEIWITFPDPQPQLSREKKRLTSPRFLNMYQIVLKSGGAVNL